MHLLLLHKLCICFTLAVLVYCKDEWDYKNIEKWPGMCKYGKQQSPIDLNDQIALETDFESIKFRNYHKKFGAMIKNNGHTVLLMLKLDDDDDAPSISEGNLTKKFIFHSLHFHWPAEHTINGKLCALEAHFVHYNSKYKEIGEAVNKSDGFAVLGVHFKLSPDDDDLIDSIFDVFTNISRNENERIKLESAIALKDFLPRDKAGFFRYDGSLTSPNCGENVIWTVFTNTLPISKKQLDYFKTIYSHSQPLLINNRPLQKLNNRKLYLRRSPKGVCARNSLSFPLLAVTLLMKAM